MGSLSKLFSYISVGMGGALVVKSAGGEYSFSGWIILGVVSVIVVGIIIMTYRLTDKVDLVALVRAWRQRPPFEKGVDASDQADETTALSEGTTQ